MTNSDYIAISSAVIALLAMAATFWQAWVTRKHNYLSVRPLLAWHIERKSTPEGAEIAFLIKNKGIGPALVMERYFTVGDNRFTCIGPHTEEVLELVQKVLGNRFNYTVKKYGLPGKGSAILPQEEVVVAHIHFPGMPHDTLTAIMSIANNIEFYLDYESLYGQKEKLRTGGSKAR